MAEQGRSPDVVIEYPNRGKPVVLATKAVVILLLLASVGLMLLVTIGGWSALAGMQPVQIGYMLVYLVLAYYAARWNRGVLPLAAALAIILLIFAIVAGPQWFSRDKTGYTQPLFGANLVGLLTLLIIPVQVLLIVFAMRGFQQDWHVEVEHHPDEPYGDGGSEDEEYEEGPYGPPTTGAAPA
jgi:hypothetical protein